MSGTTFAGVVDTPPMPKTVKDYTQKWVLSRLREMYLATASPIDGPGKIEYGHIEAMVCWPKNVHETMHDEFRSICKVIGAKHVKWDGLDPNIARFAIPYPSERAVYNIGGGEMSEDDYDNFSHKDTYSKLFGKSDTESISSNSGDQKGKGKDIEKPSAEEIGNKSWIRRLMPEIKQYTNSLWGKSAVTGSDSNGESSRSGATTGQRLLKMASISRKDGKPPHGYRLLPVHDFYPDKDLVSSLRFILDQEEDRQRRKRAGIPVTPPEWAEPEQAATAERDDRFVQVNIRICPSLESLEWLLFRHSHEDLWTILNQTMHEYHLLVDHVGLWLQHPDVLYERQPLTKVLLTSEPVRCLQFLGLPVKRYFEGPFIDIDEMFEYMALCEEFQVLPKSWEELLLFDVEVEKEKEALKMANWVGTKPIDIPGAKKAVQKNPIYYIENNCSPQAHIWLQLIRDCPNFRLWETVWTRKWLNEGKYLEPRITLEEIYAKAMKTFGPDVKYDYETQKAAADIRFHKEKIWYLIVCPLFPEITSKSNVPYKVLQRLGSLRAVKKIILDRSDTYGLVASKHMFDKFGYINVDYVRMWLNEKKDIIEDAAMLRFDGAWAERQQRSTVKAMWHILSL